MPTIDPSFQAQYESFLHTFPVPELLPAALRPALDRWALSSFAAHRSFLAEVEAENHALAHPADRDALARWKQLRALRILAHRDAAAMERAFFDSIKRYRSLEKSLAPPLPAPPPPAEADSEHFDLEYTPELAQEAQAFLDRQDPSFLNDPDHAASLNRIRRAIAAAHARKQQSPNQTRN